MNWLKNLFTKTTPSVKPPAGISFRLANEHDLPGLEWEGKYKHFRRLYEDTFKRTMFGVALMWLAELPENQIAGQCFVQLSSSNHALADGKERAYVFAFRIKEDLRGRGIGTALLRHVENDLISRTFSFICLNVARDNPRAIALYQRNGYHILGADPGLWSYQDDQGKWCYVEEPAWRMEKKLT